MAGRDGRGVRWWWGPSPGLWVSSEGLLPHRPVQCLSSGHSLLCPQGRAFSLSLLILASMPGSRCIGFPGAPSPQPLPQLKLPSRSGDMTFPVMVFIRNPKMSLKHLRKETISRNSEGEGPLLLLPTPSPFCSQGLGGFAFSPEVIVGNLQQPHPGHDR